MNYLRNIGNGQASTTAVVITASITVVGSIFASWATASGTANQRISDVNERVTSVTVTEDLHYKEVNKTLERIEKKLDKTILSQ